MGKILNNLSATRYLRDSHPGAGLGKAILHEGKGKKGGKVKRIENFAGEGNSFIRMTKLNFTKNLHNPKKNITRKMKESVLIETGLSAK